MKESLIESEDNIENAKLNYIQIKKLKNYIEKHYNTVIKEYFTEENWIKEGKKIVSDIKNFETYKIKLENYLKLISNNNDYNDDVNTKIRALLDKIEKETIPKISAIKEKTQNFEPHYFDFNEYENDLNKKDVIINDLYEEKRKIEEKQKEDLMKTYLRIKDTQEAMMNDVNKQGVMLDEIEKNVEEEEKSKNVNLEIKTEEKVEKKDEEPSLMDKLKICCSKYGVIIVFFLLGFTIGLLIGINLNN